MAIWLCDYCVVNGVRKHLAKKKRANRPKNSKVSMGEEMETHEATSSLTKDQQENGNDDENKKDFDF